MKILLTGAAGIVGKLVRPYLSDTFEEVVLLTHKTPCEKLKANERSVHGDIEDRSFVESVLSEVEGVIHLAGLVGPDYTFDQVLGPNFVGTYNIFEAARKEGVTQIIYASSHHAVGFIPRGSTIDEHAPLRPDSYYGVSKAFGEILSAYFADKYGLNILSVRIGSVTEKIEDERRTHTWCSPRDLARLFELGLTRNTQGHRLVYGVSKCPDPFFDNSSAEDIGYEPMDYSLDFVVDPSILDTKPDPALPENLFIGGYFASGGLSEESLQRLRVQMEEEEL